MLILDLIEEFMERLDGRQDASSLNDLFSNSLSKLGFINYAFHIYDSGAANMAGRYRQEGPCCVASNFPAHCLEQLDLLVRSLCRDRRAVRWMDLPESKELEERIKSRLQVLWDGQLGHGITLPVVMDFGETAFFSLLPTAVGTEVGPGVEALPVALILAQAYLRKARAISAGELLKPDSSRRRAVLSPREVDVLNWTARGKTSKEIAAALGISQKSVDFYADIAKTKLQAVNRTHAVVRAAMLGLVNLVW